MERGIHETGTHGERDAWREGHMRQGHMERGTHKTGIHETGRLTEHRH